MEEAAVRELTGVLRETGPNRVLTQTQNRRAAKTSFDFLNPLPEGALSIMAASGLPQAIMIPPLRLSGLASLRLSRTGACTSLPNR